MGDAVRPEIGHDRQRLLHPRAHDELVRHLDRLGVDCIGRHTGAES